MTSCDDLFGVMDNPMSPGLKVSTPTIQVEVGKTFRCNATASTKAKLIFTSADPSIATVDSYGVITGVKEGKTTVTVTTEGVDDTYKKMFNTESMTVAVEVYKNHVKGLELSKTDMMVTLGEDDDPVTLKATVSPTDASDKTVVWKSSDEAVAKVDDKGVVTFVGQGSATITATATNGTEETDDDVEATCEVIVNVPVDLTSITDGAIPDYAALTGTLDGSANNIALTIADGATVTLDGMTINGDHGDGGTAYKHAGLTIDGDVTIILKGENVVTGFNRDYPGIYVTPGSTLTIKGDGQLEASSGSDGTYSYGAGIGGGRNLDCGNIVIESGTIIAKGSNCAAGIGGGGSRSSCGDITIKGGDITASTEGYGGAAIGVTGALSTGGDITITGGTIKAEVKGTTNKTGVGIGCGMIGTPGKVGNITITGGDITATGGSSDGVGIGAYNEGKCGDIDISGGTIVATGSKYGAGIGTGRGRSNSESTHSTCGKITITGGDITATGGQYAAGIGTGYSRDGVGYSICGDITITVGVTQVTATKGEDATNSIGAGVDGACGTITIGGVVKAQSDFTDATYTYRP